MRNKKLNKSRTTTFDFIVIAVFTLLALITLYPFWNVLILSVSNTVSVAKHTPYLLPYIVDLTGYKTVLQDIYFIKSLGISLFVTIAGVMINMFLSVTGAYVLSKRQLIGRKVFMTMILFTMLFNGGLVPTYMIIKDLGLINSIWSMILPTAISTYYLIIMKNYFLNLPAGLIEAARLDGAGEWTILWKVAIPISKPFIATFALFYSVERWNEWYNALLYINKKDLAPLQIYLRDILVNLSGQLSAQAQQMLSATEKVSTSAVQMATIIITAVPIICVYPFLQKYFVNGVMVGGLKE
ncbi:MAG TPA: carbohydrate ABC transporter permease [Lachnospiraceae bacterium]|nr:carbohydrate ABC transporter permease [Lachnospiraceae bacterium]